MTHGHQGTFLPKTAPDYAIPAAGDGGDDRQPPLFSRPQCGDPDRKPNNEGLGDDVTANLIEMTESQLVDVMHRSLSSLSLHDWTPDGWKEVQSWSHE